MKTIRRKREDDAGDPWAYDSEQPCRRPRHRIRPPGLDGFASGWVDRFHLAVSVALMVVAVALAALLLVYGL